MRENCDLVFASGDKASVTEYFDKLDEQQLRRARLRLLEKESMSK
jgi:hypothetical protein